MINELFASKERYFWSKSVDKENTYVIGGYYQARFYGMIEIVLLDTELVIRTMIGDGYQNTWTLADQRHFKGSPDYEMINAVIPEIDNYINKHETKSYQDSNRLELMVNLMNYLPKYSEDGRVL